MNLEPIWILLLGLFTEAHAGTRDPAPLPAASNAQFEEIGEPYIVRPDDTLSTILFDRGVDGSAPGRVLYGRSGWLKRNQDLNKQIKNWKSLKPGQKIELILPVRSASSALKQNDALVARPKSLSDPLSPSSPAPSAELSSRQPLFMDAKALLGLKLGNFAEELPAVSTETAGQIGIPAVSGELLVGIRQEESGPGWRYGLTGAVSMHQPLDSISFPTSWELAGKVVAGQILSLGGPMKAQLSPYLEFGVASFAYVSSESDSESTNPHFSRTNISLWNRAGARLDTNLFGIWTELDAAVLYSPLGTSRAASQADISTTGLGGRLQWRVGVFRTVFAQVDFNTIRLSGDGLTLSTQNLGFGLGLKF